MVPPAHVFRVTVIESRVGIRSLDAQELSTIQHIHIHTRGAEMKSSKNEQRAELLRRERARRESESRAQVLSKMSIYCDSHTRLSLLCLRRVLSATRPSSIDGAARSCFQSANYGFVLP